MKKFELSGKTAIVTGASSGIGKTLCFLLKENGVKKIIGAARSEEKLNAVKKELGDVFIPFVTDVSLRAEWQKLRDFVLSENCGADIIINCAGVLPKFSDFKNCRDGDVETITAINYFSIVYSAEYILPVLRESGDGLMINVASSSALCPFGKVSLYSASKAAAERFSECLSCEEKTVSVVTVLPGFTKTDVMRNQIMTEKDLKLVNKISAPLDKTCRKILKKAIKRKKRIITGLDAELMNLGYGLMPAKTPRIITETLEKSSIDAFGDE